MYKDSVDSDQLSSDIDIHNFQKRVLYLKSVCIVRSIKTNTVSKFFHILALSQTSCGV